MSTGSDHFAVRVRDPESVEDEPAQESMRVPARGAGGATARNPDTDQLRLRREMNRTTSPVEPRTASRTGDTSMPTDQQYEAGLLQAMAAAPTLGEQRAIGAQLEAFRADRRGRIRQEASLDLASRAVETVYPTAFAAPGVHTTAATDWLGEVTEESPDLGMVSQDMVASASLWYRRVPEAVRADAEEFTVQAQGMAAREGSRWGLRAAEARRAFMDHVDHLHGRRVVANDVPQIPHQYPNGSGLPEAVDNPETFDDSMWGPAGPPDRETSASDSPSLAEGEEPEGDQAMQIDNPAADATHDQANPNTTATDYLDGQQTPAQWGSGMQTMNSLIARTALRVLAESGQVQDGVVNEPLPSSQNDQLTPSQQMGDTPETDQPMTFAPAVELTPHDAGPGNGPATDYLDGQQYAFATLRPLAVLARAIPRDALDSMSGEALTFASALLRLRSTAETLGDVPAREIVAALLRTGGAALPPALAAELAAHLRVQAGDLPPWMKDKDEDDDSEGDSDAPEDEDDDGKDSSESSSDEDDSDEDSDSDDDSDDDESKDDSEDEDDEDAEKKQAAFRARVQAGLAGQKG